MSSPREPKYRKGKATRDVLLETGMQLISKKGFHNVLADNIAAEAGFSIGTFYSYFTDKHDLLVKGAEKKNAEIKEFVSVKMKRIIPAGSTDLHAFIREALSMFLGIHRKNQNLFRELESLAMHDAEIRETIQVADNTIISVLSGVFQDIGNRLSETEAERAACTVFYASQGIIHSVNDGGHKKDFSEGVFLEFEKMLTVYLQNVVFPSGR